MAAHLYQLAAGGESKEEMQKGQSAKSQSVQYKNGHIAHSLSGLVVFPPEESRCSLYGP